MGTQGATCFHTLKDVSRDIPQPAWDDVRFGMVCTSAQNLVDIKNWLEKLCSYSKDCDYSELKQLDKLFKNAEYFQSLRQFKLEKD